MYNVLSSCNRAPRAISIFDVRLINADTTRVRREKIHRIARPPCARHRRKERHFFLQLHRIHICSVRTYAFYIVPCFIKYALE